MRKKYINTLKLYEDNCIENSSADFAEYIVDIENTLNILDDMLAAYCTIAYMDGVESREYMVMAVAIISKNMDYIYNAHILNKKGQYAATRVIFRNIYESLIILKTVSLTNNHMLLNNWMSGEEINLRREIFSKIEYPQSEAMKKLWNDLCRFCHGTVYSVQETFEYSSVKRNIEYNYIVIIMLLYMNYHVLNRYVFPDGMKAKADRWIYIEGEVPIKEKKQILKEMFKRRKSNFREEPRRVLTDFSKVWKFKE